MGCSGVERGVHLQLGYSYRYSFSVCMTLLQLAGGVQQSIFLPSTGLFHCSFRVETLIGLAHSLILLSSLNQQRLCHLIMSFFTQQFRMRFLLPANQSACIQSIKPPKHSTFRPNHHSSGQNTIAIPPTSANSHASEP